MKLNKILLFIVMIFCMSAIALAADYQGGETIRIDAFYTEAGVYADANANITIELPDGTVNVSNEAMTEVETGVFYYDYTIPEDTGQFKVTVRFYDDSWNLLGLDSRLFDVGSSYAFTLGSAPSTENQLDTMWIVLGVLITLALIGVVMKISLMTMFCGVILLIMCVVTFPFSTIVGVINLMLGVMFLLAGGFSRS